MTTLVEDLIPLADELRAMHDEFGTRGYTVKMVAIKRHSKDDGTEKAGEVEILYEHTISPTPRVRRMNPHMDLALIGLESMGDIVVDQISLTYEQSELLGEDYTETADVEFYWELSVKIPGQTAPRRMRYRPSGIPLTEPTKLGWSVKLEATVSDREPDGDWMPPY